jgi:hypothetical protein
MAKYDEEVGDLEQAAAMIGIEEGAVLEHGITVVYYFDDQGERQFGWVTHGTPKVDQTLGALTVLEHALVWEAMRGEDDD